MPRWLRCGTRHRRSPYRWHGRHRRPPLRSRPPRKSPGRRPRCGTWHSPLERRLDHPHPNGGTPPPRHRRGLSRPNHPQMGSPPLPPRSIRPRGTRDIRPQGSLPRDTRGIQPRGTRGSRGRALRWGSRGTVRESPHNLPTTTRPTTTQEPQIKKLSTSSCILSSWNKIDFSGRHHIGTRSHTLYRSSPPFPHRTTSLSTNTKCPGLPTQPDPTHLTTFVCRM